MRGINFHIDDAEEKRRDKIDMTNRELFFLGVEAAEKRKKGPDGPEDNIPTEV